MGTLARISTFPYLKVNVCLVFIWHETTGGSIVKSSARLVHSASVLTTAVHLNENKILIEYNTILTLFVPSSKVENSRSYRIRRKTRNFRKQFWKNIEISILY